MNRRTKLLALSLVIVMFLALTFVQVQPAKAVAEPTTPSPADGSTITTATPTLSWTSTGSTNYLLQISKSRDFNPDNLTSPSGVGVSDVGWYSVYSTAAAGAGISAADFASIHGTSALTVEVWFYPLSVGAGHSYQQFVCKGYAPNSWAAPYVSYTINQNGANAYLQFEVTAGGTNAFAIGGAGTLVANRWTYAAATYNQADGVYRLRLYEAISSADGLTTPSMPASTAEIGDAVGTNNPIQYNGGYLTSLGRYDTVNGWAEEVNGYVAMIRIWTKCLTKAEIDSQYSSQTITVSLDSMGAFYDFREAQDILILKNQVQARSLFSPTDLSLTGASASDVYYTANSPRVFTISQAGVSYNTPSLSDATYYWHVASRQSDGNYVWSHTWSFNVLTALPSVPTLVNPSNNSVANSLRPTLEWNQVTNPYGLNPSTYQLYVGLDKSFSTMILCNVTVSQPWFNVTVNLATGTNHYWKVRAINTLSISSSWSGTFQFTAQQAVASITVPVIYRDQNDASLNEYINLAAFNTTYHRSIQDAAGVWNTLSPYLPIINMYTSGEYVNISVRDWMGSTIVSNQQYSFAPTILVYLNLWNIKCANYLPELVAAKSNGTYITLWQTVGSKNNSITEWIYTDTFSKLIPPGNWNLTVLYPWYTAVNVTGLTVTYRLTINANYLAVLTANATSDIMGAISTTTGQVLAVSAQFTTAQQNNYYYFTNINSTVSDLREMNAILYPDTTPQGGKSWYDYVGLFISSVINNVIYIIAGSLIASLAALVTYGVSGWRRYWSEKTRNDKRRHSAEWVPT